MSFNPTAGMSGSGQKRRCGPTVLPARSRETPEQPQHRLDRQLLARLQREHVGAWQAAAATFRVARYAQNLSRYCVGETPRWRMNTRRSAAGDPRPHRCAMAFRASAVSSSRRHAACRRTDVTNSAGAWPVSSRNARMKLKRKGTAEAGPRQRSAVAVPAAMSSSGGCYGTSTRYPLTL